MKYALKPEERGLILGLHLGDSIELVAGEQTILITLCRIKGSQAAVCLKADRSIGIHRKPKKAVSPAKEASEGDRFIGMTAKQIQKQMRKEE